MRERGLFSLHEPVASATQPQTNERKWLDGRMDGQALIYDNIMLPQHRFATFNVEHLFYIL